MHAHAHICTHVHAHTHACTHTRTHKHMHTHTHTHTCMCTHTHTHTQTIQPPCDWEGEGSSYWIGYQISDLTKSQHFCLQSPSINYSFNILICKVPIFQPAKFQYVNLQSLSLAFSVFTILLFLSRCPNSQWSFLMPFLFIWSFVSQRKLVSLTVIKSVISGSRIDKHWFRVRDNKNQTDRMLNILPYNPKMVLPFTIGTAKTLKDLFSLLQVYYKNCCC